MLYCCSVVQRVSRLLLLCSPPELCSPLRCSSAPAHIDGPYYNGQGYGDVPEIVILARNGLQPSGQMAVMAPLQPSGQYKQQQGQSHGQPPAGESPDPDCSAGYKGQRNAVVAVALAGGPWAVVEDVALVPTAAPAVVFAARHDQFEIQLGDHGIAQGLPEAGPAGAAVELGLGAEQGQPAAGADEGAAAMLLVERAGERALRAFTAQHGEGCWAEALLPFGFTEIPGGINSFGGGACPLGRKERDQSHNGCAPALQQLADQGSSGMERHWVSAHPAGAEHDGQHQKDSQEAPADAIEGVFGAAGTGEHGAAAGGQTAHAITFGAVQQHADDHQDAAEHPDPGDGGAKHVDGGNALTDRIVG